MKKLNLFFNIFYSQKQNKDWPTIIKLGEIIMTLRVFYFYK